MSHYPHHKTVRKIAENNWGKDYPSLDSAEKEMLGPKTTLADAALLEIVRRLNQVIKALARDADGDYQPRDLAKPPEHAVIIPGLKVGDVLYECDEMEYGVCTSIVVSVEPTGHARIVYSSSRPNDSGQVCVHWVDKTYFTTAKDALRLAAENDLAWHEPRAAWARECLAALNAGEDIDKFIDGMDVPAE